ncbi:unnamed protein product [Onchocerca flexuosa]|uniref:Basic proline-rich protein-like n=1 Tax=Onchocerca flexuosa TaxID=387005 RepID=A0A183HP62_9BILA|nr:unnamed protein product [Onchocerca flexuosa]
MRAFGWCGQRHRVRPKTTNTHGHPPEHLAGLVHLSLAGRPGSVFRVGGQAVGCHQESFDPCRSGSEPDRSAPPTQPPSTARGHSFKSWGGRPGGPPPAGPSKRATDRQLSREPAAAARELRGRPAGTHCQTGSVLVRISTLSHRRGQENGTRQHFCRKSLGEVRRPDGREERGREGERFLTSHPRGSGMLSHQRGTAGQCQAARAPAPRNTSPSPRSLSPPFSIPGETPFVTPTTALLGKAPYPCVCVRAHGVCKTKDAHNMHTPPPLHVESTPPYYGSETKRKGTHPSPT